MWTLDDRSEGPNETAKRYSLGGVMRSGVWLACSLHYACVSADGPFRS
jgi:hypothetical protein